MASVRRAQDQDSDYPAVLLFHLGTPEEGDAFLGEYWPEARAVSDPKGGIYEAFGIGRGTPGQYLGWRALRSGLLGLLRGHRAGRPVGDVKRMSGAVAIRDRRVIWSHVYRHSGDHPDFAALPSLLED